MNSLNAIMNCYCQTHMHSVQVQLAPDLGGTLISQQLRWYNSLHWTHWIIPSLGSIGDLHLQKICSFIFLVIFEPGQTRLSSLWVGNFSSFWFSKESRRCCRIFETSQLQQDGSMPYVRAVATAMANRPQEDESVCDCILIRQKFSTFCFGLRKEHICFLQLSVMYWCILS